MRNTKVLDDDEELKRIFRFQDHCNEEQSSRHRVTQRFMKLEITGGEETVRRLRRETHAGDREAEPSTHSGRKRGRESEGKPGRLRKGGS